MKRYVAFLTAVLAATACIPKQPQFAPEEAITHFATTAPVQEVADAAAISLRWLGFSARKVPTGRTGHSARVVPPQSPIP